MSDLPRRPPSRRSSSSPSSSTSPELTLADVGEDGILAAIFPLLPLPSCALLGPGDDAAVVRVPDGRVVTSTDVLVEDRDFRRDWSTPQDVGWKAAAQNLADIAAMGAVPTALLVGVVAPPELPVSWMSGLAEGLVAACHGTGAGVVGGDLSSGAQVVVSVTVLGDLQGRPPVLRSGAVPGQLVGVAGRLGWSAAGWDVLRCGLVDSVSSIGDHSEFVAAHRRPQPPYAAGVAAAQAGASGMLDISDGLLRDAARLAQASHVTIDLDQAALVGTFGLVLQETAELLRHNGSVDVGQLSEAHASGHRCDAAEYFDEMSWVLTGGEDHAILATFNPDATLPAEFVLIGTVLAPSAAGPRVTMDGHDLPVNEGTHDGNNHTSAGEGTFLSNIGWDHFRRHR